MPLWMQGVLELGQAAIISAVMVLVPVAAVWLSGGFADRSAVGALRLAGQVWLLIHGVPLTVTFPPDVIAGASSAGVISLVPLGLTLIPFFLAWRAGRRLARASYTDQLWQALIGALSSYAVLAAIIAYFSTSNEVSVSLTAGALIPLISAGLGIFIGAYREAGAWSRLIGVDLAGWISRTSQHSRWAGSYVRSALRAGFIAVVATLGFSALLLAVTMGLHWADVVAVYERLDAGIVGGLVLTIGQLGVLPNLVAWTMAWSSGAGFALGTGSSVSPLATSVGPLPAVPIFGAVPVGTLEYGFAALAIPLLAGVLAGWWFFREGENHFDEWLVIKSSARWLTASVSTLCLGALVGIAAGVGAGVIAFVSHVSLGIGTLVDLGPNPLWTALWVAAEVAVGVVVGHMAGPLLEREPRR